MYFYIYVVYYGQMFRLKILYFLVLNFFWYNVYTSILKRFKRVEHKLSTFKRIVIIVYIVNKKV